MNFLENTSGIKFMKKYFGLLDKYKNSLDDYQKTLLECKELIEMDKQTEEDKMAAVQVALDLTYLKEELETMKLSQDKLHEEIESLQGAISKGRNQREIEDCMEALESRSKETNRQIIALILLNILSVGGVVFTILYVTGVICF